MDSHEQPQNNDTPPDDPHAATPPAAGQAADDEPLYSPRAMWWIRLGYILCLALLVPTTCWTAKEWFEQRRLNGALEVLRAGAGEAAGEEAVEFLLPFGEEAALYLIQELQQNRTGDSDMRDAVAAQKFVRNRLHMVGKLQEWRLKDLAAAWRDEKNAVRSGLALKFQRFLDEEPVGSVVITLAEGERLDRILRRWRLQIQLVDAAVKLREALDIESVDLKNVEIKPPEASRIRRLADELMNRDLVVSFTRTDQWQRFRSATDSASPDTVVLTPGGARQLEAAVSLVKPISSPGLIEVQGDVLFTALAGPVGGQAALELTGDPVSGRVALRFQAHPSGKGEYTLEVAPGGGALLGWVLVAVGMLLLAGGVVLFILRSDSRRPLVIVACGALGLAGAGVSVVGGLKIAKAAATVLGRLVARSDKSGTTHHWHLRYNSATQQVEGHVDGALVGRGWAKLPDGGVRVRLSAQGAAARVTWSKVAIEWDKEYVSDLADLPGKLRDLATLYEVKKLRQDDATADQTRPAYPRLTALEKAWVREIRGSGKIRAAVYQAELAAGTIDEKVTQEDLDEAQRKAAAESEKKARQALTDAAELLRRLSSDPPAGEPLEANPELGQVLRALADYVERNELQLPGKLRRIAAGERVGRMTVSEREREVIEVYYAARLKVFRQKRLRFAAALRRVAEAAGKRGEQFNNVTLFYLINLLGDEQEAVTDAARRSLLTMGAEAVPLCIKTIQRTHINEAYVVETDDETKEERRVTLRAILKRKRQGATAVLRDIIVGNVLEEKTAQRDGKRLLRAIRKSLVEMRNDKHLGETVREIYRHPYFRQHGWTLPADAGAEEPK